MKTEKTVYKNDKIGAQYTILHHPSGLDIYLMKMEGFSTVNAAFATRYGSVNTTFKTGDDKDFVTVPMGIAHYLEHKLFENEDCDVFELYAKTGANGNAYTSFDQTVYTFSCTDNYLDSLGILLDFVQAPYFTEQTVEKERGIIAQEIKMCSDSPERQCFYNLLKAMYVNHPVRIDIAGTVESIQEINAELLYKCYNAFYDLHNMILVIAGDVDEDDILAVCDEHLKSSKDRQLEVSFPDEPYEVAQEVISESFTVGTPLFNIGFKCDAAKGQELLKKQLCANMLIQLISNSASPLYKKLYELGLINNAFSSEVFFGEGYFSCIFDGESNEPLKVRDMIIEEIERIKREGIDSERFEIIKKSAYGSLVWEFNNTEICVNNLLGAGLMRVDLFDTVDHLAALTEQDLMDNIDELFDTKRVAVSIIQN
ncbi:MAG: insulinase family protein [Ruminococcus sp.]|nr:insulinase family protein [Ruminococcus sp.]